VAAAFRPDGLVAAALLVVALPGPLYAVSLLLRRGPPPATAEARERYLSSRLPLYPALAHLATLGSSATVYAVNAENLVYHASGPFLGDWMGPHRYQLVEPLSRHAPAFARALRSRGVRYLLVPRGSSWPDLSSGAFEERFSLAHEDAVARVFRLR
jgi:hypothetical protein